MQVHLIQHSQITRFPATLLPSTTSWVYFREAAQTVELTPMHRPIAYNIGHRPEGGLNRSEVNTNMVVSLIRVSEDHEVRTIDSIK